MANYSLNKAELIRFPPYTRGSTQYTNGVRQYLSRVGTGQTPFTDKPLPCDTKWVAYLSGTPKKGYKTQDCHTSAWPNCYKYVQGPHQHPEYAMANNTALQRLMEEINTGGSELLTAAAEFGDTLSLIALRVESINNLVRGLRQRDITRIIKGFQSRPKAPPISNSLGPRVRRVNGREYRKGRNSGDPIQTASRAHAQAIKSAKDAGAAWLEWWFAISPTISDVETSMAFLSKEFPEGTFYGSAKGTTSYSYVNSSQTWYETGEAELKIRCGADVRVSNPNAFLLQQLGLANPLQTAWDVIPFSWLLGWAVDVSSFLGGFTTWLGLEKKNEWTTVFMRCNGHVKDISKPDPNKPATWQTFEGEIEGVRMIRTPGYLPKPVIVAKVPTISVTRAATACGLLIQGLRDPKFIR